MMVMFILFAMQFPLGEPFLRTMRDVPPKDGALRIVLHNMPTGLDWGLTLMVSDGDHKFLARDLIAGSPSRIIELKISDGRIDIDLERLTASLFMDIFMPLHTQIFIQTEDGKEIYTDHMRRASRYSSRRNRSNPLLECLDALRHEDICRNG